MSASRAPGAEAGALENNVVVIRSSADIVTARQRGRALAAELGFTGGDLVVIATTISELARDIIEYATTGVIVLPSGCREVRRLMDEFDIVSRAGQGTTITVRKWLP